jgi:hypothetical protein
VYDGLENGEMDIGEILSLLPDCVPEGSETIAGYKVYAVDATANEHEQAEIRKAQVRARAKLQLLSEMNSLSLSQLFRDVKSTITLISDELVAHMPLQRRRLDRDPARQPRRQYDQSIELWLAPGMDYAPVRLRLTQPNGDSADYQWSSTDRG